MWSPPPANALMWRLYHVPGEFETAGGRAEGAGGGPAGSGSFLAGNRYELPVSACCSARRLGRVAVAGYVRVVVHECPLRVVPPRPHVQSVEGRDAVAVGARVEMEELAHQRGRRLVGRVPGGRDHDVLYAHQLELAPLR